MTFDSDVGDFLENNSFCRKESSWIEPHPNMFEIVWAWYAAAAGACHAG
jgi:hypothetical protein